MDKYFPRLRFPLKALIAEARGASDLFCPHSQLQNNLMKSLHTNLIFEIWQSIEDNVCRTAAARKFWCLPIQHASSFTWAHTLTRVSQISNQIIALKRVFDTSDWDTLQTGFILLECCAIKLLAELKYSPTPDQAITIITSRIKQNLRNSRESCQYK